jgi:hypothetical protein
VSSLYRTSKAKYPEARQVDTKRDLRLNLPSQTSQSSTGLTAPGVFVVSGFLTLIFGFLDTFIFGTHTLLTTIAFAVTALFVASRTSARSPWAAWTAPVISLFFMLLITSPFGDNQFGGTLSTVLLVTLLGLSDRTWIILTITMICWVIARRTEVKEKSRQRQLARSRKN